jgi:hypothetical protein
LTHCAGFPQDAPPSPENDACWRSSILWASFSCTEMIKEICKKCIQEVCLEKHCVPWCSDVYCLIMSHQYTPILVVYHEFSICFLYCPIQRQFSYGYSHSIPLPRPASATWDGPASSSESSGDEDPMQAEGSRLAGRWPPWPWGGVVFRS